MDFLVLEYLDGETLASRLKKGPLPVDIALRYAIEIAGALDRAHRGAASSIDGDSGFACCFVRLRIAVRIGPSFR